MTATAVPPRPRSTADPGRPGLGALLEDLVRAHRPTRALGSVPGSIPHLAEVDHTRFGIAVAMASGEVFEAGDAAVPFSVQSISKVFSLALALGHDGGSGLWSRVHREPSGTAFNSLVQLEAERGIPRNPFINAGALVVTDHLIDAVGDASGEVLRLLAAPSGRGAVNEDAFAAELARSGRNLALAHLLADLGNLRNPADAVVHHYVRQCSVEMSCADVARAGLFLADDGVGPGGRVVSPAVAKRLGAVMLTCGMYDAAGEFAYRVGLPSKSGVGGGILAIVPGVCAVCVWSPRLDAHGNSIAGAAALAELAERTGWSIF
ncbi:glutaminase [Sinomonas halotolerans]|uniref:Glutaminase n=1 Tax=Sinomonas halotolerans TaxID=1644133 RepID=A0ABU9X5T4_9MICC